MPQSLAKNAIHLIFSTKERKPYLTDAIRSELHSYMATVLKNMDCPALLINSVEDHVHVLFLFYRTEALSQAVGDVKKSSSKWLKTQSPHLEFFSWQAGFGAFSVSESSIPSVKNIYKTNKNITAKFPSKRNYGHFWENMLWNLTNGMFGISSPFQGFMNLFDRIPRALPWASIGDAVGVWGQYTFSKEVIV